MKQKRIVLSLFLFLCISAVYKAQHAKDTLSRKYQKKQERKSNNKFIIGHIGFVNYNYKDFMVSPLLYSGTKLTESLQYYARGDKKIKSFKFMLASGSLKNQVKVAETPTKLTHYYLEFYRLYYINSFLKDKWKLYLGYNPSVNLDIRANTKFQNSALQYNGQIDIAPMMQIDRRFDLAANGKFFRKKEKSIRLAWQLSIPLVSLITRPTYNGITPGMGPADKVVNDLIFGQMIGGLQGRSLNNYFRMANNVSVDFYFKNNNGIKLSYVSDVVNMYKNIAGKRLQYSNGGLMIGLMLKLDNNNLK